MKQPGKKPKGTKPSKKATLIVKKEQGVATQELATTTEVQDFFSPSFSKALNNLIASGTCVIAKETK